MYLYLEAINVLLKMHENNFEIQRWQERNDLVLNTWERYKFLESPFTPHFLFSFYKGFNHRFWDINAFLWGVKKGKNLHFDVEGGGVNFWKYKPLKNEELST